MGEQSPITILNVDDSTVGRYAITRTLQQAGFKVREAATGADALRLALEQPDLIVLDVQLPDMTGFEVCQQIKANPETFSIPVLHLSAKYVTSEDKVQGLDSGADAYLVQPVESIELIATVKALLRIRQAEEKARATAREWQTTFDAISDAVCLLDFSGTIVRCNAAMIELLKQPLGEIQGQLFHSLVQERLGLVEIDSLPHIHKTRRREILELQSDSHWFRVTADPVFDDSSAITGSVYILADITSRKRLENSVQQRAAELAQANRIKDEFLATLSHELRTPLNSILGWAKLLRTRSFDRDTTTRALETIERNAKSQSQLIEDILDVSRMITGKHRLNTRPVELVTVIEAALNAVLPAADAKGIDLQSQLAAVGDLILGDSDRLQQIIWNLLSNAIKFTPAGGRVEIRLVSTGSHVEIQVSDTGKGISADFLPYVFDRFRQADGTTTRSQTGLGLGLALVRHLVELHGGSVLASSPGEGHGATFTVQLPLLSVKERSGDRSSPGASGTAEGQSETFPESQSHPLTELLLAGLQVLVVDDEPDTREFIAIALQQYGAVVKAVASAPEAMGVLEGWQPDVLVSDIGMPQEDGYELIRKVRASEAGRGTQIPAVALTAYARNEDRTRAIAEGFQMHMSKPVQLGELAELVANLAKNY
jgi:signal transduction histidine kinase